jgi:two-component system OmpR family sensor kinase
MKRESILLKLNTLFSIALMTTLISAWLIHQHLMKKEQREFFFQSRLLLKEIRTTKMIPYDLLEEFNFETIEGAERKNVLYYGIKHPKKRLFITYQGGRYLHIKRRGIDLLLKGEDNRFEKQLIPLAIFGVTLTLLVMMYLLLRRSLTPLRDLKEDIRLYGEGKEVRFAPKEGGDEVSLVYNAFYRSIESLERLRGSRELLIRNLFHELNTPVTKGKLLVELVDDSKTKKMLDSIFSRLSILLRELAQIEQISSGSYAVNTRAIPIEALIDEAMDLLYIDTPLCYNPSPMMMQADFSLMRIVFKNLIDNAIKYGTQVEIITYEEEVHFINRAKPLNRPLEFYTQAFSRANEGEGFGLGLYIVQEILQRHGMVLDYRHEFDKNIFIIRV